MSDRPIYYIVWFNGKLSGFITQDEHEAKAAQKEHQNAEIERVREGEEWPHAYYDID